MRTFLNQKRSSSKKVVFLDELPWLNTPRSAFVKHLEHFWNSYRLKAKGSDPGCMWFGSILDDTAYYWTQKGGLHNRITRHIRLMPFHFPKSLITWGKRESRTWTTFRSCKYTWPLGGIPYYWSFVRKGQSAAQVIDELLFVDGAPLREEYVNLLASLFDHSEQHERILLSLAGKRKGLPRNEMLKASQLRSGGRASGFIRELETSGFISSYIPFGKKSNDALYRLSDEFVLFHLHWIAPMGKQQAGRGYWIKRQSGSGYHAWSGYCYEGICMKHIEQIKYHMRIDMIESNSSPWAYHPARSSGEEGAQIDLLIDRQDMVINICEMKFSRSAFSIDAAYARDLRRKTEVFRRQTGTKKNLFLTMITTFGLSQNSHSISLNAIDVRMEALFEKL